jgi:hypothetical protein
MAGTLCEGSEHKIVQNQWEGIFSAKRRKYFLEFGRSCQISRIETWACFQIKLKVAILQHLSPKGLASFTSFLRPDFLSKCQNSGVAKTALPKSTLTNFFWHQALVATAAAKVLGATDHSSVEIRADVRA